MRTFLLFLLSAVFMLTAIGGRESVKTKYEQSPPQFRIFNLGEFEGEYLSVFVVSGRSIFGDVNPSVNAVISYDTVIISDDIVDSTELKLGYYYTGFFFPTHLIFVVHSEIQHALNYYSSPLDGTDSPLIFRQPLYDVGAKSIDPEGEHLQYRSYLAIYSVRLDQLSWGDGPDFIHFLEPEEHKSSENQEF